jgi:cold shock CspA family protein
MAKSGVRPSSGIKAGTAAEREIPLQIHFKEIDGSAAIEKLIREKVSWLGRLHAHLTACRIVIEVPHRSPGGRKAALAITIELEVPGRNKIIAKDSEERRETKNDQLAFIHRAFDAAHRQLEETVDIRQGAVKQHGSTAETGMVVRLFPEQNYGFIEVKGAPDLYFTRNAVIGRNFDDLAVGVTVAITRATGEGPMGPQASSVRSLDATRSAP